jgi:MarR family transcriptional regulator for hemolysin
MVLARLARRPGCSQTELAEMMEVERATAGRLLDRLEENGLVRREPDPVDRRVRRVFPTPSAATAQAKIRGVADKIVAEATIDLSDDQRETLMDLMTMVKGRLSEVVQSRSTMPETAAQSTAAE